MSGQHEMIFDSSEKVGIKNQPDGSKILKTLLKLYADQEGVKIKYRIEKGGKVVEANAS